MDIIGQLFNHQDAERHYNDIYYTEQVTPQHQSSWTHEAVAGAAGFAAMKAYESHLRATGQQPTHEVMKEILAAIAAAEVDKLAETKGLDWIDREKAKRQATQQAHYLADQRYGGGTGWEYAQQAGGQSRAYEFGGYGGGGYGGGGYGGGGYGPPPGPPQGYYPPQQGYGYPPPQGYQQGYPPPQGYQQGYPPPQGYGQGEYREEHHHHHHRENW